MSEILKFFTFRENGKYFNLCGYVCTRDAEGEHDSFQTASLIKNSFGVIHHSRKNYVHFIQ